MNQGRVQTALGVTCNVVMACVAEEARPPHFTVTCDVHVWLGATMREWEERRECAGRDAHRVCAEGAGEGLMASEGAEGGEPVPIRVPISADTEIAESGHSNGGTDQTHHHEVAHLVGEHGKRHDRDAWHSKHDDCRVCSAFTIFVSVTRRYVTDVLPLLPLRNRSHLPIHSCRGGQNAEIVSSQSKIACYPLPYLEGVFGQNPF